MAVTFTGVSGLQASGYTNSLLIGSQTWAISMFLRVPLDMGTDDAINNTRIMLGLDQNLSPYTYTLPNQQQATAYASDQDVFSLAAYATGSSSTVGLNIRVNYGDSFGDSGTVISRGKPNHLVFGPDPVNRIIQIYLNGDPIGNGNSQSYSNEPWPPGSTSHLRFGSNSPYAIRLGNLDLIATYPGVYTPDNSPGDMGATTFSIEQVAVWDGYFPTADEVAKLKGKIVTPDQITPAALRIWWSLAAKEGNPTTGNDSLVNRANPGTFDLIPV